MKLEDIEELRADLISLEPEETECMDVDDLQRELLSILKLKEMLEASKKNYADQCNSTLKLVKARLNRLTQILDERRV